MAKLRIVSHSGESFVDRAEAGRLLAAELTEWRGHKAVVLGIPRGGIIVAREVARALEGELDVVLAHKLGAPNHAELAVGSVAEDGKLFLNDAVVRDLGVSDDYIQHEKGRQLAQLQRRIAMIRRVRPKVPLKGKMVIVTDDGVATGATTQAALWAVRAERPAYLIGAIPVGPEDTIGRLAGDVDEMLCLRTPALFAAVGQFYERFYPVEDEDMLRVLRDEYRRTQGGASSK